MFFFLYFLVPSAGFGIYSGVKYLKGSKFALSSPLIVDSYIIEDLKLIDFVFAPKNDEFYSLLLFGPALMFNHLNGKASNSEIFWIPGLNSASQSVPLRPFTTYPSLTFRAKSMISSGQEVTFTYGGESYFHERNATLDFGTSKYVNSDYSISELRKVGKCLTDIVVKPSTLPLAGKGVFTERKFQSGELVTVSPVLVVPKHAIIRGGRGLVLINYCLSTNNTDVAILPVGTAGMINHGKPDQVNVELRWYDWHGRDVMSILDTIDVERDLIGAKSARLFLGYYATRPISSGEELLMSYGNEWEEEWKRYLNILSVWLNSKTGDIEGDTLLNAPQFRHHIDLPQQLIPSTFLNSSFSKCIGVNLDCVGEASLMRPTHIHLELDRDINTRFNKEEIQSALDGKIRKIASGFTNILNYFFK